jgi:hypothetical protein
MGHWTAFCVIDFPISFSSSCLYTRNFTGELRRSESDYIYQVRSWRLAILVVVFSDLPRHAGMVSVSIGTAVSFTVLPDKLYVTLELN